MRKFIIVLFFLFLPSYVRASADALVSLQSVELNGKAVHIAGYLINGNNYFKIRDLAAALKNTSSRFDVSYDKEREAVKIIFGGKYEGSEGDLKPLVKGTKKALESPQVIFKDEEPLKVSIYSIDGNNYLKLRDLANVLNFSVKYDNARSVVEIFTKELGDNLEGVEEITLSAFPKKGVPLRKYLYAISFSVKGAKEATPNYDSSENILVLLTDSGENVQLGSLKAILTQGEKKTEVVIDKTGVITFEAMEEVGAKFDESYTITLFLNMNGEEIPLFYLKH